MNVAVLCLAACSSAAAALAWEGEYFDPDELKITVSRSGANLLASSVDWQITGTLTSETRVRLAGLDGTLSASGIAWSNGVLWSRKAVAVPVAPPTWPGTYHAARGPEAGAVPARAHTEPVRERAPRAEAWRRLDSKAVRSESEAGPRVPLCQRQRVQGRGLTRRARARNACRVCLLHSCACVATRGRHRHRARARAGLPLALLFAAIFFVGRSMKSVEACLPGPPEPPQLKVSYSRASSKDTPFPGSMDVAQEMETPYTHVDADSAPRRNFGVSLCVALAAVIGAACGGGLVYHIGTYDGCSAWPWAKQETPLGHEKRKLTALMPTLPAPCKDWEARCRSGASKAASQGFGSYWPGDLCADGAKLSCANRAPAWSSASVAELPVNRAQHAGGVTDSLATEALFLFLPGTGTAVDKVHSLLSAAADMGYHAVGLAYASMPTAVSQMNLWCTRPGADAERCNTEVHDAVLFGTPTTAEGAGGLWDVPAEQSVESLLVGALQELGWAHFLTADGARVRWERVVVSGHSQGASHAAYLSVARKVRAALLFSGPQEHPDAAAGWLSAAAADSTLRRAVYALHEECGDAPVDRGSYCAALFPQRLRRNLEAMGLRSGYVGNVSGYVVVDYNPLLHEGRYFHDSTARQDKAPPPVESLWRTVLGEM